MSGVITSIVLLALRAAGLLTISERLEVLSTNRAEIHAGGNVEFDQLVVRCNNPRCGCYTMS
mgnify:CR=1 FL=1